MNIEKLPDILKNEETYRLKQAERALYGDAVGSWQEVSPLSVKIRTVLEKELPIMFDFSTIKSLKNRTLKSLIKLSDGIIIETVLLRHNDLRNTVCVSSQAGCPMNCAFCATARAGFKRNLTDFEIAEQVLFFKYFLKGSGSKVSNVVFMGMGEPLLNYKNLIAAIEILNDPDKFNIGARKISISTCGIPEKISMLADEGFQVNLAVSLNAPNNLLRTKLMPVNEKYPLERLMPAIRHYISRTRRRVMFEYVLIEDLNDSKSNAHELAALLKDMLCFVNLIPFNGVGAIRPPKAEKIRQFKKTLEERGIAVTQRYAFGRDISAACGQLVYRDSND